MHVFVINMARSRARRAHITSELVRTGVTYQLVTAVDGLEFDIHDDGVLDPSRSDLSCTERWARTWFRPGVAACTMSHLTAIQSVLESGHAAALVVEDDVLLPPDLAVLIDSIAAHMSGAEVALLNFDSPVATRLSGVGVVELGESRQLLDPVDSGQLSSAAAYVITREACERMLATMFPLRACPDDWGFFLNLGVLDRVRCVNPMPAHKDPSFKSTIDYNGNGSLKSRLRSLPLHRLPVVNSMVVARRRRIFRRWNRTEILDQAVLLQNPVSGGS